MEPKKVINREQANCCVCGKPIKIGEMCWLYGMVKVPKDIAKHPNQHIRSKSCLTC